MTEAEVTADDPDLPGVILTMRLANMGAAVFLVVVAVGFRVQRTIESFIQRENLPD